VTNPPDIESAVERLRRAVNEGLDDHWITYPENDPMLIRQALDEVMTDQTPSAVERLRGLVNKMPTNEQHNFDLRHRTLQALDEVERELQEAIAWAEAAEAKLAESKRQRLVSIQTDMGPCDFVPLAQAEEEKATLEAQLEEARADSRRLDWLDEHGATGEVCDITDDPQDGCRWFINPCYEGETLRQAIDAAMSAAEGEG
jgi:hypothetical protein